MALSKPIHLRVSSKFYTQLKANAAACEKTISAYVRDIIVFGVSGVPVLRPRKVIRYKNANAK